MAGSPAEANVGKPEKTPFVEADFTKCLGAQIALRSHDGSVQKWYYIQHLSDDIELSMVMPILWDV
jgi:hypothetical protein